MKLSKRLFALLIGLVLAFSLALPAFAEDDEPDPAMPVITLQPRETITLKLDDGDLHIYVEANISNRDPIGYQWYVIPKEGGAATPIIEDASGPELSRVFNYREGTKFFVVVYNKADSSATDGLHRVQSEESTLTIIKPSFWDRIVYFFKLVGGSIILYGPLFIFTMPLYLYVAFSVLR